MYSTHCFPMWFQSSFKMAGVRACFYSSNHAFSWNSGKHVVIVLVCTHDHEIFHGHFWNGGLDDDKYPDGSIWSMKWYSKNEEIGSTTKLQLAEQTLEQTIKEQAVAIKKKVATIFRFCKNVTNECIWFYVTKCLPRSGTLPSWKGNFLVFKRCRSDFGERLQLIAKVVNSKW